MDVMVLVKLLVGGVLLALVVIVVSTIVQSMKSRRMKRAMDAQKRLKKGRRAGRELPEATSLGRTRENWEIRKERLEQGVNVRKGGNAL